MEMIPEEIIIKIWKEYLGKRSKCMFFLTSKYIYQIVKEFIPVCFGCNTRTVFGEQTVWYLDDNLTVRIGPAIEPKYICYENCCSGGNFLIIKSNKLTCFNCAMYTHKIRYCKYKD